MLHIVTEGPDRTRLAEDLSSAVVVVESDKGFAHGSFLAAFEELSSIEVRNRAIGYAAAQGVADPRVNDSPSAPYAVNAQGIPLEQVKSRDGEPLLLTDPLMQPHRYRSSVRIIKRLV